MQTWRRLLPFLGAAAFLAPSMATTPTSFASTPVQPVITAAPNLTTDASQPSGSMDAASPYRVVDTRIGLGGLTKLGANSTGTFFTDVPGGTVAVVLNVTTLNTEGPGYLQLYGHGAQAPTTSNINPVPGEVVVNQTTLAVTDGRIDVYTYAATDLIVDMQGWYDRSDSGKATVGRFHKLKNGPVRVMDTRKSGSFKNGQSVPVNVLGALGVDAHHVSAVVVSVTITNPTASTYLTLWPDGQPMPVVSNVNAGRAGQTVANQAVVAVSAAGNFEVYAYAATDVLLDITGYFTGDGDENLSDGMFTPLVVPQRAVDTRNGGKQLDPKVNPQYVLALDKLDKYGVPNEAMGLAINMTITNAAGAGYASVYPDELSRGDLPPSKELKTSNLNYPAPSGPDPVSAAVGVYAPTGSALGGSHVLFYSRAAADLVVDVAGWFQ